MRDPEALLQEARIQFLDCRRAKEIVHNHIESRNAIDDLLNSSSWHVSEAKEIAEGVSNLKVQYQICDRNHGRCVSCILKKYFPFFVGEPDQKFGSILNRRVEREAAALGILYACGGPVKTPTLLSTNIQADWNLMLTIAPASQVNYLELEQIGALGKQLAALRNIRGFPKELASENLVTDTINYRLRLGRFDSLPESITRSLANYIKDSYICERTFVHGDVTVKNLLVSPATGTLWLLDFEQANHGDPLSDLGFLASDLAVAELRQGSDGWIKRVRQRISFLFSNYWRALKRSCSEIEERWLFLHFVVGCLYRSETLRFLPGSFQVDASAYLRNLVIALLSAESSKLLDVGTLEELLAMV